MRFSGGRRVGDNRLSRGNGGSGHAGADTGNEQQGQGQQGRVGRHIRGVSEQQVEHHRPRQTDQEHRSSANPVRDPSPDRGEQELHQRKRRHQEADDRAILPPFSADQVGNVQFAKAWQQGQDDAKTEQINEDDEENNQQVRWEPFPGGVEETTLVWSASVVGWGVVGASAGG